jgi:hypothetical protein
MAVEKTDLHVLSKACLEDWQTRLALASFLETDLRARGVLNVPGKYIVMLLERYLGAVTNPALADQDRENNNDGDRTREHDKKTGEGGEGTGSC